MKKSKKRIIAALIAALSLTVISGGIINASAKEKESVVVKDDFSNVKNAGTVDENYWAKFGDDNSTVGQTNDGKSTLKFLKKKSNGEMVAALSREKYAMKSLQFDFFMEKGFTSWMGVNLLESTFIFEEIVYYGGHSTNDQVLLIQFTKPVSNELW